MVLRLNYEKFKKVAMMDKKREDLETILSAVIITKSFILQSLEKFIKYKDNFTEDEQKQASSALVTTLQVLIEYENYVRESKNKEDAQ